MNKKFALAWLVLLIFFWVFRNTPWYPFAS